MLSFMFCVYLRHWHIPHTRLLFTFSAVLNMSLRFKTTKNVHLAWVLRYRTFLLSKQHHVRACWLNFHICEYYLLGKVWLHLSGFIILHFKCNYFILWYRLTLTIADSRHWSPCYDTVLLATRCQSISAESESGIAVIVIQDKIYRMQCKVITSHRLPKTTNLVSNRWANIESMICPNT